MGLGSECLSLCVREWPEKGLLHPSAARKGTGRQFYGAHASARAVESSRHGSCCRRHPFAALLCRCLLLWLAVNLLRKNLHARVRRLRSHLRRAELML